MTLRQTSGQGGKLHPPVSPAVPRFVAFQPYRHDPDNGINRPMLIALGVGLAFLALGAAWLA